MKVKEIRIGKEGINVTLNGKIVGKVIAIEDCGRSIICAIDDDDLARKIKGGSDISMEVRGE